MTSEIKMADKMAEDKMKDKMAEDKLADEMADNFTIGQTIEESRESCRRAKSIFRCVGFDEMQCCCS